jgi:prepilin-type N-terminal cleavage/methylation domain-containing protein
MIKANKVRSEKEGEGGFSLLEVIIAISILTVGLLAVGIMQTTAIRSNDLLCASGALRIVDQDEIATWTHRIKKQVEVRIPIGKEQRDPLPRAKRNPVEIGDVDTLAHGPDIAPDYGRVPEELHVAPGRAVVALCGIAGV